MIRYYDGDGRLSLAVEHNGILYLTGQIFLKDVLRDFDQMNEVWEEWVVKGKEPARATVQAEMAAEDRLIEIVVTATVKK